MDQDKEIESLKTEITGLKIKIRRIESFLESFPSIDDYLEIERESTEGFPEDLDERYDEAYKIIVSRQKASASLLQRHMQIGYARAARLIDQLEKNGVVSPQQEEMAREVLIKNV